MKITKSQLKQIIKEEVTLLTGLYMTSKRIYFQILEDVATLVDNGLPSPEIADQIEAWVDEKKYVLKPGEKHEYVTTRNDFLNGIGDFANEYRESGDFEASKEWMINRINRKEPIQLLATWPEEG